MPIAFIIPENGKQESLEDINEGIERRHLVQSGAAEECLPLPGLLGVRSELLGLSLIHISEPTRPY